MELKSKDIGLGVGVVLSGLVFWLIALGGLFAGFGDPVYTIAAAIAAGFLFRGCT